MKMENIFKLLFFLCMQKKIVENMLKNINMSQAYNKTF